MPDRLFSAFKNMYTFLCATDFDSFFQPERIIIFIPFLPCDSIATFKHSISRTAARFFKVILEMLKMRENYRRFWKRSVPPPKNKFYSF